MVYRLKGRDAEEIVAEGKDYGVKIAPFKNVPVLNMEGHEMRIKGNRCVYFVDEGDGIWSKIFYNPDGEKGKKWIAIRLNVVKDEPGLLKQNDRGGHRRSVAFGYSNSFKAFVEEMPVFIYVCEEDADVADALSNIVVDMKRSLNG